MPELTGVVGLTARLHHALGWREEKRNATDQMSVVGTSVWTGRALQVGYDGLEIVGLAHLYSAL
jgi:hypothetical protein